MFPGAKSSTILEVFTGNGKSLTISEMFCSFSFFSLFLLLFVQFFSFLFLLFFLLSKDGEKPSSTTQQKRVGKSSYTKRRCQAKKEAKGKARPRQFFLK